jgi:hypothetical protein
LFLLKEEEDGGDDDNEEEGGDREESGKEQEEASQDDTKALIEHASSTASQRLRDGRQRQRNQNPVFLVYFQLFLFLTCSIKKIIISKVSLKPFIIIVFIVIIKRLLSASIGMH